MKLSPERAKAISVGQRPTKNRVIMEALKGRKIKPLQGRIRLVDLFTGRCPVLISLRLSALTKTHRIKNIQLKN